MSRRVLAGLAAALLTAAAHGAFAQASSPPAASAPTPLPPNDYSDKAAWLCWPGKTGNACDVDLATTVVNADGSTRTEPFKADSGAPIDCFYVYPTVSLDPGLLATMNIEPAETRVVEQQFARFGASCRLYAPMYRQFTLTALFEAMQGHPLPGTTSERPTTPYDDVRDAFAYYLAHENHGRGFVLIGHSQGSSLLTQLIKNEIDGKPAVEARLVSAILMGTSLVVPKGADVGGDFKTVPLCRNASQVACAIAYASFRDNSPPPDNSRFGRPRTPGEGLAAACVNPANLSGGEGALHSYFGVSRSIAPTADAPIDWDKGKTIATPFVSAPGLITARCVSTPQFNYLAIHVKADPASPRTSDIPGDIVVGGQVMKDWGLHLIDANLAMGNLVDLVRQEGHAWIVGKP